MARFGIVRGAAERQFRGCEAECVGGTALNDRDSLERLGRRSKVDDMVDIAGARDETPVAIDHGDDPRMTALGQPPTGGLGEDMQVLSHGA